MSKKFDVIISGAGPVGLFLACELGMRGVSVLSLERDASPDAPWKTKLGMRGINTLSAEAFYRRGMLNDILDGAASERPMQLVPTAGFQFGGHFAGIFLNANKLDLSRWKYRLPGPALLPGRTDVLRVEKALTQRAESVGVEIRRVEVTGVEQAEKSVTVRAGDARFLASYVVGCDGSRSAIRKAAGIDFVGTDPMLTGYQVVCDLVDESRLKPGWQSTDTGMYINSGRGTIFIMDFDDGAYDRAQPVTKEHIQSVLRRVSGIDVTVKTLHMSATFTDRARQAVAYRRGRLLLAGDSAHIHGPIGGQGLNTGIGDAMNLGWKLAATVKGTAPGKLLDTYESERHPIGAFVLDYIRAQVAAMRPDAFGRASRKVIEDLTKTHDGANYFMGHFFGFEQRFDLGDKHPLVGVSAPDFEFVDDSSRLGPKLSGGRGLIVDFTRDHELRELAQSWRESADYVDGKVKDTLGLTALIVRPDGIVAWVSEGTVDRNRAELVLTRWFGSVQSTTI
jgi:2-polyprenyl-6-methoxyphenol hydroxylase-like FAD-dependent oxidoreductase